MAIPLLISKKEGDKLFPNDFKLGWLIQNKKGLYWKIFGSSINKKYAIKCAISVINEYGERDVFISEEPLSEYITKEQILTLDKIYREFGVNKNKINKEDILNV